MNIKVTEIAQLLDHTVIHPTATMEDMKAGIELAKKYNVAAICVKPYAIPMAVEMLKKSDVKPCSLVGFPQGCSTKEVKVFETEHACKQGAKEVDMVVNIGKALEGDWDYIKDELIAIKSVCKEYNVALKVIFENVYINSDEVKIKLSQVCSACEVDYIKTSTGFAFVKLENGEYKANGATYNDVDLMVKNASGNTAVKAAGGVRTIDQVLKYKELGVGRIGTSATESILKQAEELFGKE